MVESVGELLAAFPFPPGPLGGPPDEYAARRAGCPFEKVRLPSGHEAVLLVTYRDAAAGLGDPRLSRNLSAPGSPRVTTTPTFYHDPEALINMDGEKHLRIRRIVAPTFTPRAVERWRSAIRRVAGELIDAMVRTGPPADLVADYCTQLPVRIICQLLGVPDGDADRFSGWTNAFSSAARMTSQERQERIGQFAEYTGSLLAAHRTAPGGDLIDELIAARDGSDRLTESELNYLVLALIATGYETTANVLGRGVLTLLDGGRALWERLLAGPDLVPAAVEELLRYNPLGNSAFLRIATEDVELPSGTVRAGQPVLFALSSAMRDEAVFEDGDTVRFDRTGPSHMAFGAGAHFCLGAHLARAELQIGLGLLLERLPALRLDADPHALRFTQGEIMSSLVSLPVAW